MYEVAETIHNFPTYAAYACAAVVGVCTIGVVAFWVARECARGGRKIAAVSLVGAMLVGGMVVVGTDGVGAKPGTNDVSQVECGTNTVTQVEGSTNNWTNVEGAGTVGQTEGRTNVLSGVVQGRACSPSAPQGAANGKSNGQALRRVRRTRPTGTDSITDDDITRGWRVVSVSSNALSASTFTMPDGATVWEDARDFGAGWGSWKIPLDGWGFTYGDIGWTNGFAWVEGYFRSRFNSRANEIRLLSERLALCPAAHWSRYNLAASRAWAATNDVDGLVVTFENAAIGDDPTKIASVQMELFPRTGEVALRYDLANVDDATYTAGLVANGTNHFVTVGAGTREVVFQRVHPDDWDMDGIPNSIDDTPREPSPNTGYNQTDAWAMAAFPSNSTEIATMGYAAWTAARAAEPNRHLIGLQVSSPENVWPICLTFGDKQVMCDGSEMLYFAIDDGARYSFELSDGALAAVDFDGSEMLDAIPVEWYFPWEYQSWPSMVTLHVDSARSGWIGRTAEVSVDGLDGSHFFPNGNETVTAVVTNCHEDAYIDCTWTGGEGISFSDNHSLTTTINWNSTNGVAWATNYVDLVTTYEGGYAITNRHGITVGPQTEPTTDFSVGCQEVFFLNDADFLEPGNCPTNRPERIRPVTLRLVGARGTGGYVSIVNEGTARAVLFQVENGVTNRIDSSTRIRIGVGGDSFTRESENTIYMSCPKLGRGTIRATWTPDEGNDLSDEANYQVIEPIRKLVSTERFNGDGPIMNPSRLVFGTNAILKVSVNLAAGDSFSSTNTIFSPQTSSGRIVSQWRTGNDWYAVVEATSDCGEFVVEARFNDDQPQPRFWLPIVHERVLHVRAFSIKPSDELTTPEWEDSDIYKRFDMANLIFSQIGVRFVLDEVRTNNVGTVEDWNLQPITRNISGEKVTYRLSDQVLRLLQTYERNDCIKVYFTGIIKEKGVGAFAIPLGYPCQGIFVGIDSTDLTLPHELGHALGLEDCLSSIQLDGKETAFVTNALSSVDRETFPRSERDWGSEQGRGFYECTDSRMKAIESLLMFGLTCGSEEPIPKMDIPDKLIMSIRPSGTNSIVQIESKVGASFVEPSDNKVYTHEND